MSELCCLCSKPIDSAKVMICISCATKKASLCVNELLLDVLWQACGEATNGLLDTGSLSAYEEAAKYLCENGFLVPDSEKSGRIFFLKEKQVK
jgi:hypothetical protein